MYRNLIGDWRLGLLAMTLAGAGLLAACGEETQPEVRQVDQPTEPALANAADDDYPLEICVVAEKRLGSMGEPHVIEHDGRTVKFCCASCTDDFHAQPEAYMAKLDEAQD